MFQPAVSRRWIPLLCLLVAADVVATFETMMVVAAIPSLVREFGDPIGVGWLMSGHYLAYAATVAIIGRLGDLYGHKRVLVITLAIVAVGSIIAAVAPSLEWIVVGRMIQGVAGGILPLCLAIVRIRVPTNRQSLSVGILLAAAGGGAAAGMIAGGFIIDNGTWQHLFILSTVLAVVMMIAIALFLPESIKSAMRRKIDIIGGTLFVPAVAALLAAISNMGNWGMTDPRFIGLLLSALLLGFIWVMWELRHPDPLLNVRLFAQRDFALLTISIAILGLSGFQTAMIQMLFLQQPLWTGVGLGLSATLAAVTKLPSNVVSAISSPLIGHLFDRFGARNVIVFGFALIGFGWFLLIVEHSTIWFVVATITLAANLGAATVFVGASAGVLKASPIERAGEAQGMFAVVRSIFIALGAQMVMIILATDSVPGGSASDGVYPTEFAYILLFGTLVFVSAVGMAVAAFVRPLNDTARQEQIANIPHATNQT